MSIYIVIYIKIQEKNIYLKYNLKYLNIYNKIHRKDKKLGKGGHENKRKEKTGSPPPPPPPPPNPLFPLLLFSCHLMTNVLSLPWRL